MQRRALLTVCGASVALTGCSGLNPSYEPNDSEAAYDRIVRLSNSFADKLSVRITIIQDGPEGTVHEARYTVDRDEEVEVYDFRDAPTEGIETYFISGELETQERASVQYRTSDCYGNPLVYVTEDGEIRATYSMC